MANYFVDSTTGDDGDDGSTMDLAWATLKYALESGGLAAGDVVFVRRLHSETLTAAITSAYDGTPTAPITVMGWPRAADSSITSATWTNGSTTVDLIVGLSMDREKHLGRFVTAPDGESYLITDITDSDTIIIEREYAGSTVSGASGACNIQADSTWVDDMGTAYSFDDSGWTIKETTWDADADDLPLIDFNSAAYYLYHYGSNYFRYHNIDFQDSTYANGMLYLRAAVLMHFEGCLFIGNTNTVVYNNDTDTFFDRCIFDGNGCDRVLQGFGGYVNLRDCSLHSADYGIQSSDEHVRWYLENVNIGIEGTILGGIRIQDSTKLTGNDVAVTGSNWDIQIQGGPPYQTYVEIENWQRTLGAHYSLRPQGTVIKLATGADPAQRTGGNADVIEVAYNDNTLISNAYSRWTQPVLTHEFEATTDNRRYRYYVQAEGAVTAAQLWMEVEYVAGHDDTSEYVIKRVTSTDAIDARSGASDWSQYIEVSDITPALASTVRVKIYCSYYHATNKIYIDPLPEVTT